MGKKTVNKTVTVSSHPRAGSHWVMRLIDINFFNGANYLKHYGGHPFGDSPRVDQFLTKLNNLTVYVSRDTMHSARSIFKMRNRFGLGVDNFRDFLITPLRDMWNGQLVTTAVRDIITDRTMEYNVDRLFAGLDETVVQYIDRHKLTWERHTCLPHFCHLTYDGLVNNFNEEMKKLAHHFDPGRTEFKDETTRVGWRDNKDNEWKKPTTV